MRRADWRTHSVLCCAVLCCVVLCCAVLCRVVPCCVETGAGFRSNTVKVDPTGVEFTVGDSGHARVTIPLHQVACVSLCPKKKDGALKVVAILCRAAGAREGTKKTKKLKHYVGPYLSDFAALWPPLTRRVMYTQMGDFGWERGGI